MKRSGPMKRTPFARSQPMGEHRPERIKPVAVALTRPVNYGAPANDAVMAIVKEPKGKAGKYAPNAEERAWMDAIVAHGCIACRIDGHGFTPPAVHHILRAGRRIGHLFTLPLCQPGHHMDGLAKGVISRHPYKARFEAHYGTELELLAKLQALLATDSTVIKQHPLETPPCNTH